MATLSDLKQDHKNARKRTETSASLLKESLQRYGPARSIVIDEDDRILAGNGTVEAALGLGIEGLRVIDANPDEIIAVRRTGLTEDQKVGLALADNRTADLAEFVRRESSGSPLFAAALIGHLVATGQVAEVTEHGVYTAPASVQDVVVQRLTRTQDGLAELLIVQQVVQAGAA